MVFTDRTVKIYWLALVDPGQAIPFKKMQSFLQSWLSTFTGMLKKDAQKGYVESFYCSDKPLIPSVLSCPWLRTPWEIPASGEMFPASAFGDRSPVGTDTVSVTVLSYTAEDPSHQPVLLKPWFPGSHTLISLTPCPSSSTALSQTPIALGVPSLACSSL